MPCDQANELERVIHHYNYTRLCSVEDHTSGHFDCTVHSRHSSLIWAIHDVRFAPNVIHAEGLASGLLQLRLVDGKDIVLQRHDLRTGTISSSTADIIERVGTHDVLVISKLEIILDDEVLVSAEENLAQSVVKHNQDSGNELLDVILV